MRKPLQPKFSASIIIGHRGAAGYVPENTLLALQKAKELNIKWVEFDVKLSRDHIPIIMHDATINRTTNGKGEVAAFNYSELAKLDAGSWFAAEFAQCTIPTLEDYLIFLKENDLNAVVEIKPYPGQDIKTAELTYQTILRVWPEGLNKIIFASFSLTSLRTIRQLSATALLGLGLHYWNRHWLDLMNELNCFSIHLNHWILTKKRLSLLKDSGCTVLAYTVNNPKRAEKLFQWGIDGLFSDFPDRI